MQVFVQFSHISIILFIILTNVLRNAQNAKLFKWSFINIFGKKEQHSSLTSNKSSQYFQNALKYCSLEHGKCI